MMSLQTNQPYCLNIQEGNGSKKKKKNHAISGNPEISGSLTSLDCNLLLGCLLGQNAVQLDLLQYLLQQGPVNRLLLLSLVPVGQATHGCVHQPGQEQPEQRGGVGCPGQRLQGADGAAKAAQLLKGAERRGMGRRGQGYR